MRPELETQIGQSYDIELPDTAEMISESKNERMNAQHSNSSSRSFFGDEKSMSLRPLSYIKIWFCSSLPAFPNNAIYMQAPRLMSVISPRTHVGVCLSAPGVACSSSSYIGSRSEATLAEHMDADA